MCKSKNSEIENKNIIIIDDGIASGQTIIAQKKLLELGGSKVVGIIVAVKHMSNRNMKVKCIILVYNIFELL